MDDITYQYLATLIKRAFVEEHRQASELSALESRLSAEMRRAEEAVARAEYAERREKDALATVARLEAQRKKLDEEAVAIESSSRNYQVQLELTERELRVTRRDGELLQEEFQQLERSHKHSQEQCRRYQTGLKESHAQMDSRETVMKISMKKWFTNGEGVGYDNGYKDGYEEGKRDGKRQGIKAGRKEGLREGIEQGRAEEQDRYNGVDPAGVRRWAQSDWLKVLLNGIIKRDALIICILHRPALSLTTTMSAPRRKVPKDLPKLPASAFNSPVTESSGILPSPSTIQPEQVIDANVTAADVAHSQWKQEAGQVLGGKIRGVVLSLPGADVDKVAKELESSSDRDRIVSLTVPFDLTKPDSAVEALVASAKIPISLSTVYNGPSTEATEGLKWALAQGRPVDIDVHVVLSEDTLEGFEDTVGKATEGLQSPPPIILSNILPPPHDLDLPIIKLMNHPTYLAFTSQVAALSLLPNVHIKFLPPAWDQPTPQTPYPGSPIDTPDAKVQREWKRRIKLYLGPVLEAFGYQRIIFGSSPSAASSAKSNAGDWYEIARESLAELVSDQEFVDAVFHGNANKVYGKAG
ncbi:hypothetical protein FA13DRAFT_1752028 [Coprinellus micaceus]|uniref:Uncharacterized protein n=1 Tax=Coprinellus micaceus TaxID=71717 RepID=A0A4Y7TW78_COPMI|nr:hypothetical protein FA13DRAFT_1752028 [Coprinellus micaceus]